MGHESKKDHYIKPAYIDPNFRIGNSFSTSQMYQNLKTHNPLEFRIGHFVVIPGIITEEDLEFTIDLEHPKAKKHIKSALKNPDNFTYIKFPYGFFHVYKKIKGKGLRSDKWFHAGILDCYGQCAYQDMGDEQLQLQESSIKSKIKDIYHALKQYAPKIKIPKIKRPKVKYI